MDEPKSDISNYLQLVVWFDAKTAKRKRRLMSFIQSKLPELQITNLTTDWNNGKALGALVDAVAPGLCPDWQDWDPENCVQNASEAMQLAEAWLSIPQLIRPEDVVSADIDENSMMNYLLPYMTAQLKPEAPLRPRSEPSSTSGQVGEAVARDETPSTSGSGPCTLWYEDERVPSTPKPLKVVPNIDVSKITVEDLEPIVYINVPTDFIVNTIKPDDDDEVTCTITNPSGAQTETLIIPKLFGAFKVIYTPFEEGNHTIEVFYNEVPIPGSPFTVEVKCEYFDPDEGLEFNISEEELSDTDLAIYKPKSS